MGLSPGKSDHEFDVVLEEGHLEDILKHQRFQFEFDFLDQEKQAASTPILTEATGSL